MMIYNADGRTDFLSLIWNLHPEFSTKPRIEFGFHEIIVAFSRYFLDFFRDISKEITGLLNREKRQLRAPLLRRNPSNLRYPYYLPVPVWTNTNQQNRPYYHHIPQNYYQFPLNYPQNYYHHYQVPQVPVKFPQNHYYYQPQVPQQVQPEQVVAEQVQPEQVQPELVQPELVQPEQVQPEQVQPEQVQPEQVDEQDETEVEFIPEENLSE